MTINEFASSITSLFTHGDLLAPDPFDALAVFIGARYDVYTTCYGWQSGTIVDVIENPYQTDGEPCLYWLADGDVCSDVLSVDQVVDAE